MTCPAIHFSVQFHALRSTVREKIVSFPSCSNKNHFGFCPPHPSNQQKIQWDVTVWANEHYIEQKKDSNIIRGCGSNRARTLSTIAAGRVTKLLSEMVHQVLALQILDKVA